MSSVAESNTKININVRIIYTDYRKFSRCELVGCKLFFAWEEKETSSGDLFLVHFERGDSGSFDLSEFGVLSDMMRKEGRNPRACTVSSLLLDHQVVGVL